MTEGENTRHFSGVRFKKATNVENYEDGSVYIVTDYEELVEEF